MQCNKVGGESLNWQAQGIAGQASKGESDKQKQKVYKNTLCSQTQARKLKVIGIVPIRGQESESEPGCTHSSESGKGESKEPSPWKSKTGKEMSRLHKPSVVVRQTNLDIEIN